jgi:hypothetical protein
MKQACIHKCSRVVGLGQEQEGSTLQDLEEVPLQLKCSRVQSRVVGMGQVQEGSTLQRLLSIVLWEACHASAIGTEKCVPPTHSLSLSLTGAVQTPQAISGRWTWL